jgi:hypothetical protein
MPTRMSLTLCDLTSCLSDHAFILAIASKCLQSIKNTSLACHLRLARRQDCFLIVALLVAYSLQQYGDTALIRACLKGHADCARLLVEAGAFKDAQNDVRHILLNSSLIVGVGFHYGRNS